MLRSVIGLLLCLSSATASAQASGIYLTGAASRASYDTERLALLSETFAAYYGDRLPGAVTLLPEPNVTPAFGVTGRINVGSFAAGLDYQFAHTVNDAEAQYANGRISRVSTSVLDHIVTVEMTVDKFGPLVLGGSFGSAFRFVGIESATIYQDGSESLGSEFRLNGIYTVPSPYFEAGIIAGLKLGDRLFVPVRVVFPMEISQDRLPLLDFDVREMNQMFPRDWDRWLTDSNGLDDGAVVSDRDFVGPRVQVGIELRIL